MTARPLRHPDRKISETFLDFAAPVLEGLPVMEPSGLVHAFDRVLMVPHAIWNAVILADCIGDTSCLDKVRGLPRGDPRGVKTVEELIARKRARFGSDERLIGKLVVTEKSGRLNVYAEAHNPYAMPRKTPAPEPV